MESFFVIIQKSPCSFSFPIISYLILYFIIDNSFLQYTCDVKNIPETHLFTVNILFRGHKRKLYHMTAHATAFNWRHKQP